MKIHQIWKSFLSPLTTKTITLERKAGGRKRMSSSLLLCVNVLLMLSLIFFRNNHWKIRYQSYPDLLPLLFVIIPYFILIRFYSFFCRPASVLPLKLYNVVLRKVAVKYIYYALKLTNFNFLTPQVQSIYINRLDRFVYYLCHDC